MPLFFSFFKLRVKETGATLNDYCSGTVGAPYVSELWVTLDLAGDRLLTAVGESLLSNVTAPSCVKSAEVGVREWRGLRFWFAW